MDTNNPIIALCISGSQAELEGRRNDAYALYTQAWTLAQDDYEACIAAHYMARTVTNPQEVFRWNQEALHRADAALDERVQSFYPSLYLNMGHSHEILGEQAEAERFYALAGALGAVHQPNKNDQKEPTVSKHKTIDEYIADFPGNVQSILEEIRQNIKDTAPEAVEAISYGIPTFKLRGKNLIHFGAYKNHIGLYPTPSGLEAFKEELSVYASGKGSAQFPLDKPMPLDLIRKIVRYRITQI